MLPFFTMNVELVMVAGSMSRLNVALIDAFTSIFAVAFAGQVEITDGLSIVVNFQE